MAKNYLGKLKTWQQILVLYGIWQIALLVIGYFASYKIGAGIHDAWSGVPGVPALLAHTFKFDAGWYAGIAQQGYTVSKSAPAFYPLFPLLVYLFSKVLHVNVSIAAFGINLVAGYAACYYLYMLASDYLKNKKAAFTALLLFLFFPAAYFMHAMYGEALFCALTFGAFYYARKRKWWTANILVAFVTASRLPGLVVAGAIGVEYLSYIEFNYKKIKPAILSFLLAPLGFVAYSAYLKHLLNDPLAMFHAYNYGEWAYQKINFNLLSSARNQAHFIKQLLLDSKIRNATRLFDEVLAFGAWILLGIAAVWAYLKKMPLSFLAFMVGNFILLGAHTTYTSDNRYILAIFPMYLLLAGWLEDQEAWVSQLVIALSSTFMILLYVLFVNGIWTG